MGRSSWQPQTRELEHAIVRDMRVISLSVDLHVLTTADHWPGGVQIYGKNGRLRRN